MCLNRRTLVIAGLSLATLAACGQTTNFFNWETAPVHPLAISPDASTLAVCNLPDNRLELFDITSGKPVALTNIPVGLDPVTVRFRTASEVWVANYISDSINIIDLPTRRVVSTLITSNEPSDIVFAGTPQRGYVSCGQPNLVQVFSTGTLQVLTNIVIDGNRPRALASSPDGTQVYVAIFESGNASTIIGTGISAGFPRPSPLNFPDAPSGGRNPPPNDGTNFNPALNPLILTAAPPRVGLIVKKNGAGRWMDDNLGDWTEFIRGTNAAFTGRVPGWDLPDHDLAVIDTASFATRYATGLMNICMALAVNPVSGQIAVVGTDGINQVRFEPRLKGIFHRVNLARVNPVSLAGTISDLNPHLTYQTAQIPLAELNRSIGDPRGMVWTADGNRAYVAGMGSDNVIRIDAQGNRSGTNSVIEVGQGATGLALDEGRHRLYVYNRFAGSISTIDTSADVVIDTRPLFDPTPVAIKLGRPHLYNTHESSGLGQAACASCHVDSRFDRLAWDLGAPTDLIVPVNPKANFANFIPVTTNSYHPMKGPMVTQTLQDIIGHEPFHWRGDRDSIEQFDGTFTNLQGAATGLTTNGMQELRDFLATVRFAPNPFRQFDNSLPANLPLPGQVSLGRGSLPAGAPLPNGNAQNGQVAFRLTTGAGCIPCHTLPAGLGTDMRFNLQWQPVPLGTNSAHHIALIELERSSQLPFKIPSLRNLFDKFGMDLAGTNSRSGFGFSHDGSVDNLVRFVQDAFTVTNDQTIADLTAFLLTFTGSDLTPGSIFDPNRSPGVASLDTQAAVGRQLTINSPASVPLLSTMIALAASGTTRVDLVVKGFKDGLPRGWFFNRTTANFLSDRQSESITADALRALAAVGSEQTYTIVPRGAGRRIGIDRDADGYSDRDELDFGSDPTNPLSLATNNPPTLSGPTNLIVLRGRPVSLNFTATDTDVPSQSLTFSLDTNAPAGAAINSTNGAFTWLAAGPPGTSTNSITIIVTDNGKPNRTDSETLSIVVTDVTADPPLLGTNGLVMTWKAIPGVSYQLQSKADLNDATWLTVPGTILVTNGIASITDPQAGTNTSRFYRLVALP
jgi:DNA-binding beta-propeller fold protein YncE